MQNENPLRETFPQLQNTPEAIAMPSNWEFNEQVADVFEEMLQRSIPDYDVMRSLVVEFAVNFATNKGAILDLGCSRGETIARLLSRLQPDIRYKMIDRSDAMIKVCQERFKDVRDRVSIDNLDLRVDFPQGQNSVVMSVLTLQFIPVEYRLQLLRRIYRSLNRGGAFILVEKTLAKTADIDDILTKVYYSLKFENGYTEYEIQRKRLSLEGVLVPWTAFQNEESLRYTGFVQSECIWRWGQFAAWIAIK
jgi:tRNA (cmo5U34)-methyltransferase